MTRSLRSILALTVSALAACSAPPPATSTQLGLHQPARMRGAVDIGRADPDESISLLVTLNRPAGSDVDGLLTELARPDSSAQFLTPAEFADQFGATVADYADLVSWVQSHGLTVVRQEPSRASLTVSGTISSIEDAFHTRIDNYQDKRGQFRAPAIEPLFDRPVLRAVVGLDDAEGWFSHARPRPPNSPAAGSAGQGPPDLAKMYGFDQVTMHGEGETIAILGTGNPPKPATDVDNFIKTFKLPIVRTAQYTQILLGGPNRDVPTLAQVEYFENVLDVNVSMGLAPGASIVHVLTATNQPGLFGDGISYIINNVPQAHAVTVSYGSCERGAESEIIGLNLLFQQAKAQGQQWFFASGDDGTDGCQDGTANAVLSAGWPGSSPYTLGVGGTQLKSGTTIEQAWTDGGGGQSEIIDKPAYQIGVGPYPNDGVRDTPDVAALAGDPGVTTTQGPAEGTSCAAPMWAATWVVLDQALGGHGIRNSHERMYQLGALGEGFHDIVAGENDGVSPGYKALTGYDLATGWGTPNLPSLIANWN